MGKVQRASEIVTSDFNLRKRIVTSDYTTKRNRKGYTENQARNRAEYLAAKLNNPSRIMFYLKCAWNLTDAYLDRLLSISLSKDDPIRYFSKSAAAEMANNS